MAYLPNVCISFWSPFQRNAAEPFHFFFFWKLRQTCSSKTQQAVSGSANFAELVHYTLPVETLPRKRWDPSSFPPSVWKNWNQHSSVPFPAGCPLPSMERWQLPSELWALQKRTHNLSSKRGKVKIVMTLFTNYRKDPENDSPGSRCCC